MSKLTELPDPYLLKIAEKARIEIARRGLDAVPSTPIMGGTMPAPCNGRNAEEQLGHARAISRIVNLLAVSYKWSDDFCLMIDVAESTARRLKFTITRPIEVKVSGPPLMLQAGDTLYVDHHGEAQIDALLHSDRGEKRVNLDLDPIYRKKLEIGQKRVDCMVRHPFAQSSDVDAILKWEETLPKVDETSCKGRKFPCGQCDDWRTLDCPFGNQIKPALPNAMVVRGGHDAAGWVSAGFF